MFQIAFSDIDYESGAIEIYQTLQESCFQFYFIMDTPITIQFSDGWQLFYKVVNDYLREVLVTFDSNKSKLLKEKQEEIKNLKFELDITNTLVREELKF